MPGRGSGWARLCACCLLYALTHPAAAKSPKVRFLGPDTPSPPTPAPPSPAPGGAATTTTTTPATLQPTAVPTTAAPTEAPPLPATGLPESAAPATPIPETSAPETAAPATPSPATGAPATPAPPRPTSGWTISPYIASVAPTPAPPPPPPPPQVRIIWEATVGSDGIPSERLAHRGLRVSLTTRGGETPGGVPIFIPPVSPPVAFALEANGTAEAPQGQRGAVWAASTYPEVDALVRFVEVNATDAYISIGPIEGFALLQTELIRIDLNISAVTSSATNTPSGDTAPRFARADSMGSPDALLAFPPLPEPGGASGGAGGGGGDYGGGTLILRVDPTRDLLRDYSEAFAVTAAVISVASLVSGPSVAHAQQLQLYFSDTCLHGVESDLGRVLHPLGAFESLRSVDGSHCLGMVLGNLSLCGAVLSLHVLLVYTCFRRKAALRGQGLLKFPAIPLFLFLFLYQGQAVCAARLLISPAQTWHRLVGFAATVINIAVPCESAYRIFANIPSAARYRLDTWVLPGSPMCPTRNGRVVSALLGPGEWVSCREGNLFAQRYNVILRPYTEAFCWWAVVEFAQMFVVGCILAADQKGYQGCGVVRMCCALTHFAFLLATIRAAPCCRPRDNVVEPLRSTLTGVGLLLASVAYFNENPSHPVMGAATRLLFAALTLLMMKVSADALAYLYAQIQSGRITQLQALEWGSRGGGLADDSPTAPLGLSLEQSGYRRSVCSTGDRSDRNALSLSGGAASLSRHSSVKGSRVGCGGARGGGCEQDSQLHIAQLPVFPAPCSGKEAVLSLASPVGAAGRGGAAPAVFTSPLTSPMSACSAVGMSRSSRSDFDRTLAQGAPVPAIPVATSLIGTGFVPPTQPVGPNPVRPRPGSGVVSPPLPPQEIGLTSSLKMPAGVAGGRRASSPLPAVGGLGGLVPPFSLDAAAVRRRRSCPATGVVMSPKMPPLGDSLGVPLSLSPMLSTSDAAKQRLRSSLSPMSSPVSPPLGASLGGASAGGSLGRSPVQGVLGVGARYSCGGASNREGHLSVGGLQGGGGGVCSPVSFLSSDGLASGRVSAVGGSQAGETHTSQSLLLMAGVVDAGVPAALQRGGDALLSDGETDREGRAEEILELQRYARSALLGEGEGEPRQQQQRSEMKGRKNSHSGTFATMTPPKRERARASTTLTRV